jgi:hypothetical protein
MWISPTYQNTDFQQPLSVDDKIIIFEDRTIGWKLDIADQVINGRKHPDGSYERLPIPGSGFATLDIIFSYFEMIAKYEGGFVDTGQSKNYFKKGFFLVFPALIQAQVPANVPGVQGNIVSLVDYALGVMWEGIRCSLYHSGLPNGRVLLTGEIQQPMGIDPQNMVLIINPHLLIPALRAHFANYVGRLRNPTNQELRQKFEARYDFDTGS